MVTAVLAVLKAGGAYLPLDPAHPRERLALILEDAQAPVILTEESLRPQVAADLRAAVLPIVLCLDREQPEPGEGGVEAAPAGPQDLAYVIYTSGSTGRPKGVAVEHHGLGALLAWARQTYSAPELAGVLASTSLCFDISVFELFAPLCSGGSVILADNLLQLPGLPAAGQVTLINTVPSAMAELLRLHAVPDSVRTVNLAGEALPQSLVEQVYLRTGVQRLFDLYGPTEDTVYSTFALRQPGAQPTIGRPLPNKQAYILDRLLQPLPVGVPGELCLGGEGLARGYWRQPALTAEKFIPHPFLPGQRLYRTADLARFRPDGTIEYLGRLDHQVKLRGFRIELGEIESVLRRHPAVQDCVVILREDSPGNPRLVAYLAADPARQPELADWRARLEHSLPHYMVPAAAVFLPSLPLTPNGKIDRKNLPLPQAEGEPGTTGMPLTRTEQALAGIWCELLGRRRVGKEDNFFELGGHSLLATRLITRLGETFGVELPLRAVFDAPRLGRQAEQIEAAVFRRIQSLDEAEAVAAMQSTA
jgi:amino acid adenylation domain-containing protein